MVINKAQHKLNKLTFILSKGNKLSRMESGCAPMQGGRYLFIQAPVNWMRLLM